MSRMKWPEIFTTGDISGKSDKELCADALTGWGTCKAGGEMPDKEIFGQVVVDIAKRLGLENGTEVELHKWADEHKAKGTLDVKHNTVTVEMSVTTLHAETADDVMQEVKQEISRVNGKILDGDYPTRITKVVQIQEDSG